jgi:hypothetical protein
MGELPPLLGQQPYGPHDCWGTERNGRATGAAPLQKAPAAAADAGRLPTASMIELLQLWTYARTIA